MATIGRTIRSAESLEVSKFMFPFFAFPLFGLLVAGLLGYGAFKAFRTHSPDSPEQTDQALETLRQRYARGEIDEEEFQSRMTRLRG